MGAVVDLVVPVHNEQAQLASSVEHLHRFLTDSFPFSWCIKVVDNASTDGTWAIATSLSDRLAGVEAMRLEEKGRGLALRTAWMSSDAQIVAYTDVDLSTDLDALLPLVAPLVSGHSDVAVGSRLAPGANIRRGVKREVLSRSYNLLLRAVFANSFHDAQCGFKAVRADVARRLVPEVRDDEWFFDTELLLLAERNGLRIHEVPVDWTDDPESRVELAQTVRDDLRGCVRMARLFARGSGVIDLGTAPRAPFADRQGRRRAVFAVIGLLSTLVTMGIFLLLQSTLDAGVAVVIALLATSGANSFAHRRWSFGRVVPGGLVRHALISAGLTLVVVLLSLGAVVGIDAAGGDLTAQVAGLGVVWSIVAVARFRLFSPPTPKSQATIEGARSDFGDGLVDPRR